MNNNNQKKIQFEVSNETQKLQQKLLENDKNTISMTEEGENLVVEQKAQKQTNKNVSFELNPSKKANISKQQLEQAQSKMVFEQEINLPDIPELVGKKSSSNFLEELEKQDINHSHGQRRKIIIKASQTTTNEGRVEINNELEFKEGMLDDDNDEDRPEQMLEPMVIGIKQAKVHKEQKEFMEILQTNKCAELQFPTGLLYRLPQGAADKNKILTVKNFFKVTECQEQRLSNNKEILAYQYQNVRKFDSSGCIIKKFNSNIDHYVKDSNQIENQDIGFIMGKVRVYQNGQTKFIVGENQFNVCSGIKSDCREEILSIDAEGKTSKNPAIYKITDIEDQFVVQPDLDFLYQK